MATRSGGPGSEQVRWARPSGARPRRGTASRSGARTATRPGSPSPATPTSRSSGTARAAGCRPGRTSRTRRRRRAPSPTRPTWPTCASGAATPTATPCSRRRSPGCAGAAGASPAPRLRSRARGWAAPGRGSASSRSGVPELAPRAGAAREVPRLRPGEVCGLRLQCGVLRRLGHLDGDRSSTAVRGRERAVRSARGSRSWAAPAGGLATRSVLPAIAEKRAGHGQEPRAPPVSDTVTARAPECQARRCRSSLGRGRVEQPAGGPPAVHPGGGQLGRRGAGQRPGDGGGLALARRPAATPPRRR